MSGLEQLKSRAQFFKRGAIIPRRVAKCSPRKKQHKLRFGSDSWVLPGKNGYVIFFHDSPTTSAIIIGTNNMAVNGSPYHPGGITHWVGDFKVDPDEFLSNINDRLKGEV